MGLSILKCYLLLGCDSLPCFHHLSHQFGLKVFDKVARTKLLENQDDFIELVLDIYTEKNTCLKLLNQNQDIKSKILEARSFLKSHKGLEIDCIPLYSVLELQWRRVTYHLAIVTNCVDRMDLSKSGYYEDKGEVKVKLQDEEDKYYFLPKRMIEGCGCKAAGGCGKRCSCHSAKFGPHRMFKCSRVSCKCTCIKIQREQEQISEMLKNCEQLVSESESDLSTPELSSCSDINSSDADD